MPLYVLHQLGSSCCWSCLALRRCLFSFLSWLVVSPVTHDPLFSTGASKSVMVWCVCAGSACCVGPGRMWFERYPPLKSVVRVIRRYARVNGQSGKRSIPIVVQGKNKEKFTKEKQLDSPSPLSNRGRPIFVAHALKFRSGRCVVCFVASADVFARISGGCCMMLASAP